MAQAISGIAKAIVENGNLYTAGEEKLFLYTDTVQLVHVSDTEVAILKSRKAIRSSGRCTLPKRSSNPEKTSKLSMP